LRYAPIPIYQLQPTANCEELGDLERFIAPTFCERAFAPSGYKESLLADAGALAALGPPAISYLLLGRERTYGEHRGVWT
jgi:hypothetical protein